MKKPLTEEQLAELKSAFDLLDKDEKGYVEFRELQEVLFSYGILTTEEESKVLTQLISVDGEDKFDFPEFIIFLFNSLKETSPKEDYSDIFGLIDKDNIGTISIQDIKSYFDSINEDFKVEKIEENFKEIDKEGKGRIDLTQFNQLLA
jgi:Ca2+-binding EF-hand superfamily protein